MIKKSMKNYTSDSKTDKILSKVLNARQLAIKLLANVTYGYTAASYSGRMPCSDIADAIVSLAKTILQWTINEINSNPIWNAKVIYGDTDSVFILLANRTKSEAFELGYIIANYITNKLPENMILKFEKIYLNCILITKKRYVGNCYETIHQKESFIDAKGIEMIRRDSVPIVMQIQQYCLQILFQMNGLNDISLIKSYLLKQWYLIKQSNNNNQLNINSFIIRKEVKYGKYKTFSSQPPGAIIINKQLITDEMAVPPDRWKVPYLVINGLTKANLNELIIDPNEFLQRNNNNLINNRINSNYYIDKCINPALIRILSLCGIDVMKWYHNMLKPKVITRKILYQTIQSNNQSNKSNETIKLKYNNNSNNKINQKQQSMDLFTIQNNCKICFKDAKPNKTLCELCYNNKQQTYQILLNQLNQSYDHNHQLTLLCHNCSKISSLSEFFMKNEIIGSKCCNSLDCDIFYKRYNLIRSIEDYETAMNDLD